MELQRLRNVTNPFFAVNRVEPAKVLAVSKVEYVFKARLNLASATKVTIIYRSSLNYFLLFRFLTLRHTSMQPV